MSFASELRSVSLALHSRAHLTGRVPQVRRPSLPGVVQYLSDTRGAQAAFRDRFPVPVPRDLVAALDRDLEALLTADPTAGADLDARWASPYGAPSYGAYLHTLPVSRLGCHWYNANFALASGGGRVVFERVRGVLPDGFRSAFFEAWDEAEIDGMRAAFSAEADTWDAGERTACLSETPRAFAHGMLLLATLDGPVVTEADNGYDGCAPAWATRWVTSKHDTRKPLTPNP